MLITLPNNYFGSRPLKAIILKAIIFFILSSFFIISSTSLSADSKRIITLDRSLTEIIFALDMGAHLVGRDASSKYPIEALKLPSVGFSSQVTAEGLLSLRPKLIMATSDINVRSLRVLQQLKDIGVPVEIIDNKFTLEGVKAKTRQVAKILDREKQGEALVKDLQSSVERAKVKANRAKQQHGEIRTLFIYSIRASNMTIAGRDNKVNAMLEIAQIHNLAATDFKGFKPVAPEAVIEYNPEFIIMFPFSINSAGGRDTILNSPAISATEAGKRRQLIVMEVENISFSPRLGKQIEALVNAVYAVKSPATP